MRRSSQITGIAVLLLLIMVGLVWAATLRAAHRGILTVSFLSAGKGAAVFIEAPRGRTVLVDGGADSSIVRSLSAVMPWWQRSIDVVIAAHPDASHFTGLIDVLQRYNVASIFTSSAPGSGPVWITFEKTIADVQKKGTNVATLQRGQVIDLGKGAHIEILFPDRDLSSAPASAGCIEMRLVYGTTAFMLSCGNAAVENYLVRLDGGALHADVLSIDNGTRATDSTSSLQASSALFAGFVGAQIVAQSRMTFISDGQTVSVAN